MDSNLFSNNPDFLSTLSQINARTPSPPQPEKRSTLGEIWSQLKAGAVVDLPRMIGKSMQYVSSPGSDVNLAGQYFADTAEQRGKDVEYLPSEASDSTVTGALAQGARMIPQSIAPAVGAGLIMSGVGAPAGVALLGGGALAALPAAMSQGQETFEKGLTKHGLTQEQAAAMPDDPRVIEAKNAGRINAAIEGVGETAGGALAGRFLGIGGNIAKTAIGKILNKGEQTAAQATLRSFTNPGPVGKFAGNALETALGETAVEMGQGAGQAAVEQHYGYDQKTPGEAAIEAIAPTLGMTALLLPFGIPAHASHAVKMNILTKALQDPNTAPELRTQAAEIIYNELAKNSPNAATNFAAHSFDAIHGEQETGSATYGLNLDDTVLHPLIPKATQEHIQSVESSGTLGQALGAGMREEIKNTPATLPALSETAQEQTTPAQTPASSSQGSPLFHNPQQLISMIESTPDISQRLTGPIRKALEENHQNPAFWEVMSQRQPEFATDFQRVSASLGNQPHPLNLYGRQAANLAAIAIKAQTPTQNSIEPITPATLPALSETAQEQTTPAQTPASSSQGSPLFHNPQQLISMIESTPDISQRLTGPIRKALEENHKNPAFWEVMSQRQPEFATDFQKVSASLGSQPQPLKLYGRQAANLAAIAIKAQTPTQNSIEPITPANHPALSETAQEQTVASGTVEQFTATSRKRGGQELFDVKLNPSQRRTLEVIHQEIRNGENGKRVGIYNENAPGSTQVAWGSTFPDYFKNKGYRRISALSAIHNILNGKGVTAAQRAMVEDMHQAKRWQETNAILTEQAKPSEVSAINLDEGDTLKRNGEHFKVMDVGPDGITLKDGVTMELNHEQVINYDRGSLKDESGKLKKPDASKSNTETSVDYSDRPGTHQGMKHKELQQILEPAQKISAVELIPLQSIRELPQEILDDMKQREIARPEAITLKGENGTTKIYYVADNIESSARMKELLRHEWFHAGVANKELDALHTYYSQKQPDAIKQIAKALKLDLSTTEGRRQAAGELAAREAEKGTLTLYVRRLIAKVKEWFRAIGIESDISNAEIAAIIKTAINRVTEQASNGSFLTVENSTAIKSDLKSSPAYSIADIRTKSVEVADRLNRFSDKSAFIRSDIKPAIKSASEGMAAAWDGIKAATAPMQRSEAAEEAGRILIEGMGSQEHSKEKFITELNKATMQAGVNTTRTAQAIDLMQSSVTLADKVFNRMPEKERTDFMQAMDTGEAQATKELQQIADTIKGMFQQKAKAIQDMGTGILENVRDSYFPHIWKNPEEAGKEINTRLSKRPLEGAKSFSKARVFDDIQTGLDAGFELVSTNPIDIVMLKMAEMDKYINAHQALQAMEESELVQLIPAGEKMPAGHSDISGKYGLVTKRAHQDAATGQPGELKSYRYIAREDVAQVFNNYLSQNLYTNKYIGKPFGAYMKAANTLNQFQLGVFSAFHAGFTSLEAVISHGALGIKALVRGDMKNAANYFKHAPVAWYLNPKLGDKVLKAWMGDPAAAKEMPQIVEWLTMAGARRIMDARFQTGHTQELLQAWSDGNKAGAAARLIPALVEQSGRPIMEWLVPRQKMGVFAEMANEWSAKNPKASRVETRKAMQQIWNRVDSRLGQVVYDRLFVHNIAKNLTQGLLRAPGWSFGTIAEVGGGLKDLGSFIKGTAKGERPELSDRSAYTLSLLITTAIANSILTALFTGEPPEDWKDLLAFRTGKKDERGNPERFMLPTYAKDVYAYAMQPGTTLLHKSHPMLSLVGDLIRNKDYYGVEIRHEGDNPIMQLAQAGKFTAKAFTPFWMKGAAKEMERGGSILGLTAPMIGVMPAPADLNQTAAERLARELVRARMPQGSKTAAEFEKSQLAQHLTGLARRDPTAATKEIAQARQEGKINHIQANHIASNARLEPIQIAFKRLSYEEAQRVFEIATPEEKGKLKFILARKHLYHQKAA